MNDSYERMLALGTTYGMPLIKALAILVVGWLIAKIVSAVLVKVFRRTQVDDKIAAYVTGGRSRGVALEEGIGKFVYWFILLFVFMAVFQVLGLTIITEPLNALVTKITNFLPQLLAAAILAGVAWVVATIVRMLASNLLGAFRLDEKLEKHTKGESVVEADAAAPAAAEPIDPAHPPKKRISLVKTISDALYYLVFLLFLPQILDALEMEGLAPVSDMVGEILAFLPNLLGAVVVFAIFYFVARIVQRLTVNLLASLGFDKLPEWLGFERRPGTKSASELAGYVVLVILLFLGVIQAANTLGLTVITVLANELLQGLFNILVACIIFAVGLFLARVAYNTIAASGTEQAALLASLARIAILVFTGAMALYRTGLAQEIVNLAFGALIVALGLAAGLAFGLGGREAAARTIESWRQKTGGTAVITPPDAPGE